MTTRLRKLVRRAIVRAGMLYRNARYLLFLIRKGLGLWEGYRRPLADGITDSGVPPETVREMADGLRAMGIEVSGCSFCSTHSPVADAGPLPCPFCGRVVGVRI